MILKMLTTEKKAVITVKKPIHFAVRICWGMST